jgi:hypothetical protein
MIRSYREKTEYGRTEGASDTSGLNEGFGGMDVCGKEMKGVRETEAYDRGQHLWNISKHRKIKPLTL